MSLLSLPERIFRRLVELPLELINMILHTQKLLTDGRRMTPATEQMLNSMGITHGIRRVRMSRYQSEANARGVRVREKRREHWLRHAGYWSMYTPWQYQIPRLPGPQGTSTLPQQRPEWAGNAVFVFGS